jgi:hypothetical protein
MGTLLVLRCAEAARRASCGGLLKAFTATLFCRRESEQFIRGVEGFYS